MPLTPRKSAQLFVEPLEARIAPTGLTAITNPDPTSNVGKGASNYIDYTVLPKAGKLGFVPGKTYGVPGADIYAIKLTGNGAIGTNGQSTGDQLIIYNSVDGFSGSPIVQGTNQSVVAFFRDSNGDHLVQSSELIGISMNAGAGVNVNGTVHGDIVGNLDAAAAHLTPVLQAKQTLVNINVNGNVTGNILAGGNVDQVKINGNINAIYTGTAANGHGFHFGDAGTTTGILSVPTPAANQNGPSITNVSVVSITDRFQTGNGGLHANGGEIGGVDAITIQSDTNGFRLLTGNGGGGNAEGRAGQGGRVDDVVVKGVIDPAHVVGLISITTGHGGTNGVLRGGKGGSINGVAIGYDNFDTTSLAARQSIDFLDENVLIQAGDGGLGHRGGVGGAINGVLISTTAVEDGNLSHAETAVLSGNGGSSTIAGSGRGGRAGTINQVTAENLLLPNVGTQGSILVQSGNGAASAAGGDINAVTLLGTRLAIIGGNGANGSIHGGVGGSIDTVNVLSAPGIFASDVTFNAGSGGIGSKGPGGLGGNITTVRMLASHLTSLTINSGTHANGGDSAGGVGGIGGSVRDFIINDSGDFIAQGAPVSIRTGNGGSGGIGGSDGGELNTFQMIGTDIAYTVATGNGGRVTGGGAGDAGNGGAIIQVGISNQPVNVSTIITSSGSTLITKISSGDTATVTSGNGGSAPLGLGGAGGDISGLSVTSFVNTTPQPDLNAKPTVFQPDNYRITSGNGASGGAADGKGGDITGSAAFSAFGSITTRTGNAGTNGGASADGGLLDGFVAAALGRISLTTGNGGAGGNGGSITNSGTNIVPVTDPDFGIIYLTNNRGGLNVQTGNGSVGNGVGGDGGTIENFSGYISNGGLTSLTAGNGGGGDFKRSGAGGGVDQIKLIGVNNPDFLTNGSTVTIDAGNAGFGSRAKHGRDGGSATNITIYNVDAGTLVHHIAAGNAGNGRLTGGTGGSVTDVHVGLATEAVDIGFRAGANRGYALDHAGGIFAGLGGTGANSGGVAGDVTDITAAAIASIVAGKSGIGLVDTVDKIYLDGLTQTAGNTNGSFSNFGSANLVGSVRDPNAAGASTFNANTSGLIAARVLTGNRNFVPEALETFNSSGVLDLFDLRQPAENPVITPLG